MSADRLTWVVGPWDDEPSSDSWDDADTGLQCHFLRHRHSGHLCGYVKVPDGHPWNGKHYNECDADVHGGLTFSGSLQKDGNHWLGFDCAHMGDLVPGLANYFSREHEQYRDVEFVKGECESLARQIKAAS